MPGLRRVWFQRVIKVVKFRPESNLSSAIYFSALSRRPWQIITKFDFRVHLRFLFITYTFSSWPALVAWDPIGPRAQWNEFHFLFLPTTTQSHCRVIKMTTMHASHLMMVGWVKFHFCRCLKSFTYAAFSTVDAVSSKNHIYTRSIRASMQHKNKI